MMSFGMVSVEHGAGSPGCIYNIKNITNCIWAQVYVLSIVGSNVPVLLVNQPWSEPVPLLVSMEPFFPIEIEVDEGLKTRSRCCQRGLMTLRFDPESCRKIMRESLESKSEVCTSLNVNE